MRTPRLLLVLLGLVALISLSTSPVFAIVATGSDTITEQNPNLESSGNYDLDWSYVYQYNGSSCVAIGDNWLLTAYHVADDASPSTVNLGGATYNVLNTFFYKSYGTGDNSDPDPTHTTTVDLALIQVQGQSGQTTPGYYEIYSGNIRPQNTPEVIMIGYGYEEGTINTTNYTWSTSTSRIERWGTNEIDTIQNVQYSIGSTTVLQKMLGAGFDTTDTTYEAGVATWDSGGGMFILDTSDNTWKLTGINTITTLDGGTPPPYDLTFAVDVREYNDWITTVVNNNPVPEPGTLAFLGLGAVALLKRRRK